jgi:hypothetical protein
LIVLADGVKVPPHVILKWKTVPKVLLPMKLVSDWLLVVWNRRFVEKISIVCSGYI